MEELRPYVDNITQESFIVKPYCLMAWVYIDGILMILGVTLYFYKRQLLSFICFSLAVFICIGEFLLYKELIDPFFPGEVSVNTIGVIHAATGKPKQRIIFNGHVDSMFEWTYNYLGGHVLFRTVTMVAIVAMVAFWALGICCCKEWQSWLAWAGVFSMPIWVSVLFYTNFAFVVPGANDNLTGCVCAMAVAKYVYENHLRFNETEVIIFIAGSEEAGLRGAKAYARAHPPDDVPTVFICYDTVRDLDVMKIINRDLTATQPLDQRVANLMHRGGLMGAIDLPFAPIPFGASDAGAMQQGGYPSAAFVAMSFAPADFYHTRRDDIDNLDPVVVRHGIDLAIGTALVYDAQGLDD